MKHRPISLQSRFQIVILSGLALVLLMMAGLWLREQRSQQEALAIAQENTHALLAEQMRIRGEAQVRQLADALSNPLYYFDLDAVGTLARSILRTPDVDYVLVYDRQGRILHDGSGDIAAFGQPMDDPLAAEVVAASGPQARFYGQLLDVSHPITVGDERLGGVRIGYSMAAVARAEEAALASLRDQFNAVSQRSMAWLLLMFVALIALALVGAVVVHRLLVRPIRMLGMLARRIEAGDFTGPVPESRRSDELGDLIRTFGRMRDSVVRHDRDIRRVAYTDALTGLANRLAFREALEQRLHETQGTSSQLALLFIDLDDFKRVNDTLGHEAGDDVLLQMASRIEQEVDALGLGNAVVARFGGDEFVVLLQAPEVEGASVRDHASRLAEALVARLAQPLLLHGRQVLLGASVGVAVFPDDATSASLLMKNGDIAMYQAKVAGKNCYHFYSRAMDQAVERRVKMEQELRNAWQRGELSLVYQPIYRTADRILAGAEALLRWEHPEYGSVAPSVFVDVAEQSGIIESIGPQVLRSACLEAATWPAPDGESGQAPFVSVNVSARQLRSGELVRQVAEALDESGLAPERLHLELTETSVISDEANATELLGKLRQLGVRVWLDDFGTGYSSLSHLRRVQVDGLKIDRSFITDLLRDPDDLALTSAIIAMAHSLGVVVVAEGVEREGQYQLLRERGCDLVQGYWLGHPLEPQAFVELMR